MRDPRYLSDPLKSYTDCSIVVVGLARDCARALPDTLSFCAGVEAVFAKADFIFVENSSKDATRRLLDDWLAQRGDDRVLEPHDIDDDQVRTQRIAACRNAAMEVVRSRFSASDLLMVVDMDLGLNASDAAAIPQVVDYLLSAPNVSSVFPNSKPLYYDLFALRHPFWCPGDVWQDVDRVWREWQTDDAHRTPPEDVFVRSRQMFIPPEIPPIKVDSAFGGIGIYRLALALNGIYAGFDSTGHATCEHVQFHASVPLDKYIIPSWRIEAPLEHLSSAFRVEYPYERELRLKRSRAAKRERLKTRFSMLRFLFNRARG